MTDNIALAEWGVAAVFCKLDLRSRLRRWSLALVIGLLRGWGLCACRW